MGLKCQLAINMDTQKLFTFTVGDGHYTNVNLSFLCFVRRKVKLFWDSLQKIVGELSE